MDTIPQPSTTFLPLDAARLGTWEWRLGMEDVYFPLSRTQVTLWPLTSHQTVRLSYVLRVSVITSEARGSSLVPASTVPLIGRDLSLGFRRSWVQAGCRLRANQATQTSGSAKDCFDA